MPIDEVFKRKKSNLISSIKEPNQRSFIEWTPTQIKNAFVIADNGNLSRAGQLCEEMLVDDRIDGVLETLSGVISFPFSFVPNNQSDGRSARRVIKAIEDDWWQIFPEPTLVQLIKWGRFIGSGFAHVEWPINKRTGRYVPYIDIWSPKHLKYDTNEHTWSVQTASELIPLEFKSGEWFMYQPNGSKRPWQFSPWKGSAPWWLLKRNARNDLDQFSKRLGQGVLSVETAVEAGAEQTERDQAVRILERVDELAAIGLPEGMTLKMVESKGQGHLSFKEQIVLANTSISIQLVGQNLSTEVIQGSLAAAFVHERIENRRLSQIALTLSTAIREQILVPYCRINFGDGELAPWPTWNTSPPRDQEERANVLKIVSSHITNLVNPRVGSGIPIKEIDFKELEEQFNIKLGLKSDTINESTIPPEETGRSPSSDSSE